MEEKKNVELTKEQLDEVAGGIWDEENGFSYYSRRGIELQAAAERPPIDSLTAGEGCDMLSTKRNLPREARP